MKYKNEVIIDAHLDKVIELFDDKENISKWQEGFVSMEHLSGDDGKVGAKYLLKYKMGKRDIEMTETIIERDLPRIFSATYEVKKMWNQVDNFFEKMEDGKTLYRSESQFKLKGMMLILGTLMPGAFKKQSQKYLDNFKNYVEKEVNAS